MSNVLPSFRIGHGIDIHAFSDDPARPCVLGGVTVPGARGLAGHSDADALIHAICDALLGAAGLPDIGHFFPDTDPAYRNIRSTLLLERVAAEIRAAGFSIVNIDTTVLAQSPKLAPHIPAMRETLAQVLHITPEQITIKATTTEKLGYIGRHEGLQAHAICLLQSK